MKRLMVSPISNRIYLATVKEQPGRPGLFVASGKKEDYTNEALRSTFEWFMNNMRETDKGFELTYEGVDFVLTMTRKTAPEGGK